jgi:hypothetical protein
MKTGTISLRVGFVCFAVVASALSGIAFRTDVHAH